MNTDMIINEIKVKTTYLGNRGYTLLKSELSAEQQLALKEQLMVKPYVPGAPVQVQTTFPVYRESEKKLYLPRYFGEKLFGPAKEVKITEGDDIDLVFQGTLRDYQVPAAEKYLPHVSPAGGSGLLEVFCGWGKTDWALYILSQLKKKTMIIVNKEFLGDQWIERIHKYFGDSARIGKIQGPIIDIENKDIVIVMLQSLSKKNYPSTLFDSFGFTIIDEVHHLSAEVFSCALFKIVTKYMVGLSATMDRKDGTTDVFKMFLGEIVYKKERSKDENVVVRGITYQNLQDEEYSALEMDFRGQVVSSKMISKICNYNSRSEFILLVLKDMLAENPKQQIMMLSQYKSILAYMFDAIQHRNICTVGYYVGGMKQAALKASESKQVVLATYSMAAEGLDIKTLTTLFMITPMTNIEQSVGRILRQKHAFAAVIVDFIDSHDNFQRQWGKRKRFYKEQNYPILQTTSTQYSPDIGKWKTTYVSTGATATATSKVKDKEDEDEDEDEEEGGAKGGGVCLLPFRKKI